MSGHHNLRIYTKNDNPWCKTCINSEHISGENLFSGGAYICFADCIPTNDKCKHYGKRPDKQAECRGPEVPSDLGLKIRLAYWCEANVARIIAITGTIFIFGSLLYIVSKMVNSITTI